MTAGTDEQREKVLAKVRAICLELPEASERLSHGNPSWFVRKEFVHFWEPAAKREFPSPFNLWCAAGPGVQESLVESRADRFFRPPYVGVRGWLGIRLDGRVPWGEVEALCEDAYCLVAPKKLAALLAHRR